MACVPRGAAAEKAASSHEHRRLPRVRVTPGAGADLCCGRAVHAVEVRKRAAFPRAPCRGRGRTAADLCVQHGGELPRDRRDHPHQQLRRGRRLFRAQPQQHDLDEPAQFHSGRHRTGAAGNLWERRALTLGKKPRVLCADKAIRSAQHGACRLGDAQTRVDDVLLLHPRHDDGGAPRRAVDAAPDAARGNALACSRGACPLRAARGHHLRGHL